MPSILPVSILPRATSPPTLSTNALALTHATPTNLFFQCRGVKLTNRLHAALNVNDAPVVARTSLSFDSAIPCACGEGRG